MPEHEVFTFPEGYLWLATAAGASAKIEYVRDIRVDMQRGFYKYRPPMSTAYVHRETGKVATLSCSMAHSQKSALLMFASGTTTVNATVGGYISGHNYSYTVNLWTGVLNAGGISDGEGQDETQASIRGTFENFGVG